jgi:hypothetical protein
MEQDKLSNTPNQQPSDPGGGDSGSKLASDSSGTGKAVENTKESVNEILKGDTEQSTSSRQSSGQGAGNSGGKPAPDSGETGKAVENTKESVNEILKD